MSEDTVLLFEPFSGVLRKLRKATVSFVISVRLSLSVRMEQFCSHQTDFQETYFIIFRKSVEKIQRSLKSDKHNGNLNEDNYSFLIIFLSVLLRMENASDKLCRENQNTRCRENQNTRFIFSDSFFPKVLPFYEITWKNMVQSDRPQMTV